MFFVCFCFLAFVGRWRLLGLCIGSRRLNFKALFELPSSMYRQWSAKNGTLSKTKQEPMKHYMVPVYQASAFGKLLLHSSAATVKNENLENCLQTDSALCHLHSTSGGAYFSFALFHKLKTSPPCFKLYYYIQQGQNSSASAFHQESVESHEHASEGHAGATAKQRRSVTWTWQKHCAQVILQSLTLMAVPLQEQHAGGVPSLNSGL